MMKKLQVIKGEDPGADGEAVVFPVVEVSPVEEAALVAVAHPVDGSWFGSSSHQMIHD